MTEPSIDQVLRTLKKMGCPASELTVSTLAIRNKANSYDGQPVPNTFNDLLCSVWQEGGVWKMNVFPCTTVAGTYYFENPMISDFGTAIIVPDCYPDAYMVGLHNGLPAMAQVGVLKVYRDNNRDAVMNLNEETVKPGNWYAINIHYSQENAVYVNNWSGACIVLPFAPTSAEYQAFLAPYQAAVARGVPNRFGLGLVLQKNLADPLWLKATKWVAGITLGLALLYVGYRVLRRYKLIPPLPFLEPKKIRPKETAPALPPAKNP